MTGYVPRPVWWMTTRETLAPARMRARVLEILSDGKARAPRDIYGPHGYLPSAVCRALLELVRDDLVSRAGEPGAYRYSIAAAIAEPTSIVPTQDSTPAIPRYVEPRETAP